MVFASLCPPNLVFCRAQRRGIWWLRRREKDEGYTGLDGLVGVARITSEAVGSNNVRPVYPSAQRSRLQGRSRECDRLQGGPNE